jgi:RecB family exonuclease
MEDDGAARSASSLIVRQQLAQPGLKAHDAPPLWSPDADSRPRPAHEHAVLAGLYGATSDADAALETSLRHEQPGAADPARLASVRANARREFDVPYALRSELGPWFGFVGPVRERGDPRRAPLYVTTLEGVGRCPWQTFLRRFLHVEPPPEALDALPGLGPLLLGKVVHSTLDAIVQQGIGERRGDLETVRELNPVGVPWPDAAAAEELLQETAREVLLDEGVELSGLASALASQARPYLERARALVWEQAGGQADVLGAEVTGTAELSTASGEPRPLHFRADLVERSPAGLRLTDYKTGKPFSEAVKSDTRFKYLRKRVLEGTSLQALAYRIGAGEVGATGRYLFLGPDVAPDHANVELNDAADLDEAFHTTTTALIAGIEAGSFLPRLLDNTAAKEPGSCDYCEVAEACLRGDSAAHRRLREWANRNDGADPEARELFRLGVESGE